MPHPFLFSKQSLLSFKNDALFFNYLLLFFNVSFLFLGTTSIIFQTAILNAPCPFLFSKQSLLSLKMILYLSITFFYFQKSPFYFSYHLFILPTASRFGSLLFFSEKKHGIVPCLRCLFGFACILGWRLWFFSILSAGFFCGSSLLFFIASLLTAFFWCWF